VAGVCVTRWSAQPPAGPPGPPMDPPGMPPGRPSAVQGIKPAWLTAPQQPQQQPQPQPQAQMWPPARPAPPGNGYAQDPPPPPPQQYIPQQAIQVRACPPSISMHGMNAVCVRLHMLRQRSPSPREWKALGRFPHISPPPPPPPPQFFIPVGDRPPPLPFTYGMTTTCTKLYHDLADEDRFESSHEDRCVEFLTAE